MLVAAITDRGITRNSNQDYYFVAEDLEFPLFIVADGMGGHKAGEIASKMVVETISKYLYDRKDKIIENQNILFYIKESIKHANKETYEKALQTEGCLGMGTTVTLAYIGKEAIYLGHVGDSRAYLISENKIEQITEDHSLVNALIKTGDITREEARNHPQKNLITRAVGTEEGIKVDTYIIRYNQGDKLLLCSDGLTNMVDEIKILEIINKEKDLNKANKKLIELAKENGGLDNITLININL